MGIRYDKDQRRPTNGPLIFFSDGSSEAAFSEEIRGAIITGLSFYGYRAPRSSMISFGSSEGYLEGIGMPGFVIGMFDPDKPYITIPFKALKSANLQSLYNMPSQSTSYESYCKEVESIISALNNKNHAKVVAARVIKREESLDLAETFFDFCHRFPESYIFCFYTPATGCWIGASPELLLESNGNVLNTMALAGTRLKETEKPWDDKNIEEQKIVEDYICETFSTTGLYPTIGEKYSKPTGKIEHICTPISAKIDEDNCFDLEKLLKKLSPTPALCGYPKEFALRMIRSFEAFDRGCYGGFCGPFSSNNNFCFNVVLRCASVTDHSYLIYTGGGVTAWSNVNSEWEETEIKAHNTFNK